LCAANASGRVGTWRYALVAPSLVATDAIDDSELRALWRGEHAGRAIEATAEVRAALAPSLGEAAGEPLAPSSRPDVTDARWAIVAVDELTPAWTPVAIAGHHPLAVVPLCSSAKLRAPIANLDRDALTTVAMTGTTALARGIAFLMDRAGTTYPARDIAAWFAHDDFVHVSNETSFVRGCVPGRGMEFCARESYIALLEAMHANLVELDGSHLGDHGWEWFRHTIEMYEARGWHFFGGGRDQIEATRPLELEHHGNKLAFVGCNMVRTTARTIHNGPEVGVCDRARLDWQVRDLRARGFVPIVAIQHEEVYSHDPPSSLVADLRRMAEAGAAVAFGSQAHWAHPWEVHHGAYVHYGPGNFFFDQDWAHARDAASDRLYFYKNRLLAVDHLFSRIEEHGRPRPMTARERAWFVGVLAGALAKLPRAEPWAAPSTAPPAAAIPESLLVGTEPIMFAVTRANDRYVVEFRKQPRADRVKCKKAIVELVRAKYGADPARVTIR
jgi:poly-gamma-glutamate synthesis protein (capsule biosynthesis protein)